jgi:hypothetical protein
LQTAEFKHFMNTNTVDDVIASSSDVGAAAPGFPNPNVTAITSGVLIGAKIPLMVPFVSSIQTCPLKFFTDPLAHTDPSGLVMVAVVMVKVASHSPLMYPLEISKPL